MGMIMPFMRVRTYLTRNFTDLLLASLCDPKHFRKDAVTHCTIQKRNKRLNCCLCFLHKRGGSSVQESAIPAAFQALQLRPIQRSAVSLLAGPTHFVYGHEIFTAQYPRGLARKAIGLQGTIETGVEHAAAGFGRLLKHPAI